MFGRVLSRVLMLVLVQAHVPADGSAVLVPVVLSAQDLGYHVHSHSSGRVEFENAGEYRLWACFSACDCPPAGFGPWRVHLGC